MVESPVHKGALLFRRGEFQQAADLFDQHGGGTAFEFMAAMEAHSRLQHPDRADDNCSSEASAWIRQQRDNDPGCGSGVPRNVGWQDWSVYLQLQREATRALAGPPLADLDVRLKAEPASDALLLQRARLLATWGVFDEALDDLGQLTKPPTNSADFAGLRGRILASLHRDDEALADLNQAVIAKLSDARVYAARGRIHRDRGATGLARSDLEKSLNIEHSDQAAGMLADLLLADTTGWKVLTPTAVTSKAGSTLKIQSDGSVLASGVIPEREAYTISASTDLKRIRAIRLEALPDDSLPAGGPGRHSNGNFHLNEFHVLSGSTPASVVEPFATFDANEGLRSIVDGIIDENRWSIFSQTGRAQAAFFGADFTRAAGDDLNFGMDFTKGPYTRVSLGRFRLSVSDDPAILERERKRIVVMNLADPRTRLDSAYALIGQTDEAIRRFKSALQRADSDQARRELAEVAARFDDVLPALMKQQPDDLQLQLVLARTLAERGQQLLAAGRPGRSRGRTTAGRAKFSMD